MDAADKKYKHHVDRFSASFSNFVNSLESTKYLSEMINIVTLSIGPTFTQWNCLFTHETYFNDYDPLIADVVYSRVFIFLLAR